MKRALLMLAVLLALSSQGRIPVAATTTFVGDLVGRIGGSNIELRVLYPREADPHAFEPTARELVGIRGSRVLFANGLGLEASLGRQLEALTADGVKLVEVSKGVTPREGSCTAGHDHGDHDHLVDPHIWFDPVALQTWTTNIEQTLTGLDPVNATEYARRAAAVRGELDALDAWIRAQIETVPESRRVLVTDHDALGYYAARYGLRIVGTVLPAPTTVAEPSARELAMLAATIRREKVSVLFAGGTTPPALAQRIAEETGARLVGLPACALGPAGSATGSVDGYLRELTRILVGALKASP